MRGYLLLTLLVSLLTVFLLPLRIDASWTSANDCSLVVWNNKASVLPSKYASWNERTASTQEEAQERLQTLFTQKDFVRAWETLASYCCYDWNKTGKENCEDVKEIDKKYYPSSEFFADHLVSVWMRKLDGIEDHCDAYQIDCQPDSYKVDPVARRDEISEIAQDVQGTSSQLIAELYKRYWWESADTIDRGETTLWWAYYRMCDEVLYAENFLTITWREDASKSINDNCLALIRSRYNREYLYVKSIVIKKWMDYIVNDNLRTYLREYFLDTRMSALVDKYIGMSSCFSTVLWMAQITTQCNE